MSFKVVIPARLGSTRLPNKVLREVAGAPLLEHVYRRGCESGAAEVVIATDSEQVQKLAEAFGARVCMTDTSHQSGTDRVHEVVSVLGWDASSIVVNLQGDEPAMPPRLIRQVANNLAQHPEAEIATLCYVIDDWEDWQDPGLVKVIRDTNNMALYFSRAPIPCDRSATLQQEKRLPAAGAWGHIGLYAYRASALQHYSVLPVSRLESSEALEQLRALANGMRIHVDEAETRPGTGVDTEADLATVVTELQAYS